MTFTVKPETDIVNDMIIEVVTNTPDVTDVNPGSVLRNQLEATAIELSALYTDLNTVYQGTRISTSTGTDLEELGALVGITRKTGTMASLNVSFSRNQEAPSDFTIAAGSIVSTQPNTGDAQLRFAVNSTTTFSSSIAAESHEFVNGLYHYKMGERLLGSIQNVSGTVSSLPHVFVQGTDYEIVKGVQNQLIVNPASVSIMDACDATLGWSASADATVLTTSTDAKQNGLSLNLGKGGIVTNTAFYAKTFTPVVDVTGKNFYLWLKIADAPTKAKIQQVILNTGSGGSIANGYAMTISNSALVVGWNLYKFIPSDVTSTRNGQPNISAFNHIRVSIVTNGTSDTISAGDVKMDFIIAGTSEDYYGDTFHWLETGTPTLPDTTTAFLTDYRPLSKEVACTADTVGASWNVGRNKIVYKVSVIPGIDTVNNYVPATGGTDIETDAALRSRIQLAANVAGKATSTALQQAVLAVNGVTSVSVDERPLTQTVDEAHIYTTGITNYKLNYETSLINLNLKISNTVSGPANYVYGVDYILVDSTIQWLGATTPVNGAVYYVSYDYEWLGHVNLFVAGTTTPLPPSVTTSIQTAIDDTRAAGVQVSFSEPAVITVNVSAAVLADTSNGYTFAALQPLVIDAITAFLNNKPVGENVYISELIAVSQGITGIKNTTVSLPATDIVITANEVARPGTITVTSL